VLGGLIDDGSKAREIASGLARRTHRPIIGRRFSLGRPAQTKQRNAGENCVEEATGLLRRSSCPCAPKRPFFAFCTRRRTTNTNAQTTKPLRRQTHPLSCLAVSLSSADPFPCQPPRPQTTHPLLVFAGTSDWPINPKLVFPSICFACLLRLLSRSFSSKSWNDPQRNASVRPLPSFPSHPLVPLPHSLPAHASPVSLFWSPVRTSTLRFVSHLLSKTCERKKQKERKKASCLFVPSSFLYLFLFSFLHPLETFSSPSF